MTFRITFFGIILILLFSCKEEECPDSFILNEDSKPYYVRDAIKYENIAKLKFVSENNQTIEFNKYYEEIDKVALELIEPITCDFDPSFDVDIYYERIWNKMYYSSKDLDTLKFEFFPIRGNLLNYSYDHYKEYNLENSNVIPPPFFMQRVKLKNGNIEFIDQGFIYSKGDILDRFQIDSYQVLNNNFEDVYYWTRDEVTFFYFTYEHGLVGFRGQDQIDWIRVL